MTQELDGTSWIEEIHGSNSPDNQHAPGVSLPTLNVEQYQHLLTLLNKHPEEGHNSLNGTGFTAGKPFSFLTSFKSGDWIIDSGASDHITPHLHLLSSIQQLKFPNFITMLNGKQSRIAHIGLVHLTPTLLPSNVLHVPDFQYNLLSVSKLCNQLAGRVIHDH